MYIEASLPLPPPPSPQLCARVAGRGKLFHMGASKLCRSLNFVLACPF